MSKSHISLNCNTFDTAHPANFPVGTKLEEDLEHSGLTPHLYMNRRNAEKQLLSIICMGNPFLLDLHIQQYIANTGKVNIGMMSKEVLTQQRYICIVLIAMICRAVIDTGVPEHIAYSLSDSLIQQADKMHRPEQLMEHSALAMRLYCKAVQDYKLKHTSPPVRKCCEYMMLKLHSSISMEELSQICHMSPNYISDLFRKETGFSAMQFYHQAKLQYAKHLVLHTDWNIAHISAHLSYPSQSNFTERFKKTFGTTPMQFRLLHTVD